MDFTKKLARKKPRISKNIETEGKKRFSIRGLEINDNNTGYIDFTNLRLSSEKLDLSF